MKRVTVDKSKNLVVLTFNDNFYPKGLINQAMRDFNGVCDSHFENENFILKPKSGEIDIGNLGYEFYNYLLGLIKS
ncbi:hypothetical protein HYW20_06720 [Candidatus Woesearchaeota archaeon]|nr:hypothetical protein [Candidatus Woesearchaeota archaeon]